MPRSNECATLGDDNTSLSRADESFSVLARTEGPEVRRTCVVETGEDGMLFGSLRDALRTNVCGLTVDPALCCLVCFPLREEVEVFDSASMDIRILPVRRFSLDEPLLDRGRAAMEWCLLTLFSFSDEVPSWLEAFWDDVVAV